SEAGYAEGQNVIVEYHWLEGHCERLPAVLADLVRRRAAVITTSGSAEAALAAKTATATIPIVFGVPEDPVKMGIVASLARPGGNATGINFFALETDAKRLGLMHELLPKATRYAVLVNPANAAGTQATSKTVRKQRALSGWMLCSSMPAPLLRLTRRLPHLGVNGPMPFSSRAMPSSSAALCSLPRWRYATGCRRVMLPARWSKPAF